MINFYTLKKSFWYASQGIMHAVKYNQNLQVHLFIALLVTIASLFLRVTHVDMSILGIMILLVISSEMINTSLEEMVNLITNEHRREAKIAKDVGAGMVLITTLGSVIIGILIFTPYIIKLLK